MNNKSNGEGEFFKWCPMVGHKKLFQSKINTFSYIESSITVNFLLNNNTFSNDMRGFYDDHKKSNDSFFDGLMMIIQTSDLSVYRFFLA